MFKRFRDKNRKPGWSRFISCAVLGFYLFAFVVLPAAHGFWHSNSTPVSILDSGNACPICKLDRLAIPLFTAPDLTVMPSETVAKVSLCVSIPPVADATALPSCRAPPVL
ncbi:MAG: hypothetical protein FWH27_11905 [Planctomycetaceae bacterium]|nr:hypothetical protein [Planctomycetaceae bacterium]